MLRGLLGCWSILQVVGIFYNQATFQVVELVTSLNVLRLPNTLKHVVFSRVLGKNTQKVRLFELTWRRKVHLISHGC